MINESDRDLVKFCRDMGMKSVKVVRLNHLGDTYGFDSFEFFQPVAPEAPKGVGIDGLVDLPGPTGETMPTEEDLEMYSSSAYDELQAAKELRDS